MQDPSLDVDERMIDGAYIDHDLSITSRTRRDYIRKKILPEPDANLQGRNLWIESKYRRFKAELRAGKFAMRKRPPHLVGTKSVA